MKRKITLGLFSFALAAIISSCATSNDVASNRKIQKRKYTKGFHINHSNNGIFNKTKLVDADLEEVAEVKSTPANQNLNHQELKDNLLSIAPEKKAGQKSKVTETPIETIEKTVAENTSESVRTVEIDTDQKVEDISQNQINTKQSKRQSKLVSKINKKIDQQNSADDMLILLTILCFLMPFVAVGLKTDWDIPKVLIALLLSILLWVPGVVYALLIVFDVI